MSDQVVTATKRYILDMLNFQVFGETVSWAGVDQYNSLPIFYEQELADHSEECRGALLVHKNKSTCFRLLVSTHFYKNFQKVCYRIVSLGDKILLDNPPRALLPFSNLKVDFSVADINLGLVDDTAKSFYDNLNKTGAVDKGLIISFLRFLLDCEFYVVEDREVFSDLIEESCSFPPLTFDTHYCVI